MVYIELHRLVWFVFSCIEIPTDPIPQFDWWAEWKSVKDWVQSIGWWSFTWSRHEITMSFEPKQTELPSMLWPKLKRRLIKRKLINWSSKAPVSVPLLKCHKDLWRVRGPAGNCPSPTTFAPEKTSQPQLHATEIFWNIWSEDPEHLDGSDTVAALNESQDGMSGFLDLSFSLCLPWNWDSTSWEINF